MHRKSTSKLFIALVSFKMAGQGDVTAYEMARRANVNPKTARKFLERYAGDLLTGKSSQVMENGATKVVYHIAPYKYEFWKRCAMQFGAYGIVLQLPFEGWV